MARRVKDKLLSVRIDDTLYETVKVYTEVSEVSMGDLVRDAVAEYMVNHPIADALKQRRNQDEVLKAIRESLSTEKSQAADNRVIK